MDKRFSAPSLSTRRRFLGAAGAATLAPVTALAENMVKLPHPGGPDERAITTAFPQKGALRTTNFTCAGIGPAFRTRST